MPKRKCRILADNVLAEGTERRKIMDERICGYCAHHKKDDKDWMCVNERSDNYGDYTNFTDRCIDFEGREDDGFVTRRRP